MFVLFGYSLFTSNLVVTALLLNDEFSTDLWSYFRNEESEKGGKVFFRYMKGCIIPRLQRLSKEPVNEKILTSSQ